MSDTPTPSDPTPPENADITAPKFFAVLVDGEYTGTFGIPDIPNMEPLIAGLSSNPEIIPLQERSETIGVVLGSLWNAETRTFTEPS